MVNSLSGGLGWANMRTREALYKIKMSIFGYKQRNNEHAVIHIKKTSKAKLLNLTTCL